MPRGTVSPQRAPSSLLDAVPARPLLQLVGIQGLALPGAVLRVGVLQPVPHVFVRVLEDAGVYTRDEKGQKAFMRFVNSIGLE